MKYGFVKSEQGFFSIALLCEVLGVSRSGFYDWLNHKPGTRALANQVLDSKIKEVYENNHHRYGAPRITHVLNQEAIECNQKRVARRMSKMGLRAIAKRPYKVTTDSNHTNPIYDNILARDFSTNRVNEKWVGDITYVKTDSGWLYLAVVIDLYSRAVIGWAMDKTMKKDLVCNALLMALFKRRFVKDVIVHSDRGSQYCSKKYRKIISENDLIGSMSRKGNCWDNSIAESFFHTLKTELVNQNNYKTREEAKQSIFLYIEGYYNRQRIHSAIGYKTPEMMEAA